MMIMREEIKFGITVIVIFLIGVGIGSFFERPSVVFEEIGELNHQNSETAGIQLKELAESKIKLLAVDTKGNGILTDLSVKAVSGEGRLLVDVDNLLFWVDTQQSIQTAKSVAEEYLGKKIDNVDLTYTIKVDNSSVVGGPSAGAAFTAATIAALQNKTLKKDVVITGTIESNGSIGAVGGIIPKGEAAKKGGFKIFLVPDGEKSFVEYRRIEDCENIGSVRICNINYKAVEVNVEEEIGIKVIEVSNIKEAMNYLL